MTVSTLGSPSAKAYRRRVARLPQAGEVTITTLVWIGVSVLIIAAIVALVAEEEPKVFCHITCLIDSTKDCTKCTD